MFQQDPLFWFCALAGSGLFLIQFILIFFGIDSDHDGSFQDFKWLSKQALTGFLMMFGWIGLACKRELGFSAAGAAGIGVVAGMFAMLITGMIFKLARKLRSSGTVFRIEEAVGKEGSVYQRIPKDGIGKITISLGEMTHEIDAVSLSGEEVSSFSPVQIIKKMDERTVIVVPIK